MRYFIKIQKLTSKIYFYYFLNNKFLYNKFKICKEEFSVKKDHLSNIWQKLWEAVDQVYLIVHILVS